MEKDDGIVFTPCGTYVLLRLKQLPPVARPDIAVAELAAGALNIFA